MHLGLRRIVHPQHASIVLHYSQRSLFHCAERDEIVNGKSAQRKTAATHRAEPLLLSKRLLRLHEDELPDPVSPAGIPVLVDVVESVALTEVPVMVDVVVDAISSPPILEDEADGNAEVVAEASVVADVVVLVDLT